MSLQKFNTPLQLTAILSFVLVCALSVAWAKTYQNSKVIDEEGGRIPIHGEQGKKIAAVRIPPGALSDYLDEHNISAVEITVEMAERGDNLKFTLGPSGCYFDPPLQLILAGDYVSEGMLLFNESGEALEYNSYFDGNALVFEIPHFSSYAYDDYDY